jgi:cytochrome c556
LSKVIATEGYGYHDDEDFLSHSVPMLDSAVKMANAAESGDFETYDAGLTRIYKSCQDCHTLYR